MSAALDWYKRNPSEMLKDTFGLHAEARGYYFILQDIIMSHNGRIRSQPNDVAGALGISVRKWNAIKKTLSTFMVEVEPDVFMPLLKDKNEFISTLHTDHLLINQRKYRDKQVENRTRPNKFNGLESRPSTTRGEFEESEESEEITILRAREGAPPDTGKQSANQLHKKLIDAIGKAATPRAPSSLDEIWLPEAWIEIGFDLEKLILPTIRGMSAKAAPGSIQTWKYFDAAIKQRRAEIDKPMPTMEAVNGKGNYYNQQRKSASGRKRATHLRAISAAGYELGRD